MGQKVNPNGLRLGVNKDWQSKWYAKKDYATKLNNDLKLRDFLAGYLKDAAVAEIEKLKQVYKPPVEMQEKWDESHKHYVEKAAWIKTMLAM